MDLLSYKMTNIDLGENKLKNERTDKPLIINLSKIYNPQKGER